MKQKSGNEIWKLNKMFHSSSTFEVIAVLSNIIIHFSGIFAVVFIKEYIDK